MDRNNNNASAGECARTWDSHDQPDSPKEDRELADLPRLLRLFYGIPGYVHELDDEPMLVFYLPDDYSIPEFVIRAKSCGFSAGPEEGWSKRYDGVRIYVARGHVGAENHVVVVISPDDLGDACPLCGGWDEDDEDDEDDGCEE